MHAPARASLEVFPPILPLPPSAIFSPVYIKCGPLRCSSPRGRNSGRGGAPLSSAFLGVRLVVARLAKGPAVGDNVAQFWMFVSVQHVVCHRRRHRLPVRQSSAVSPAFLAKVPGSFQHCVPPAFVPFAMVKRICAAQPNTSLFSSGPATGRHSLIGHGMTHKRRPSTPSKTESAAVCETPHL